MLRVIALGLLGMVVLQAAMLVVTTPWAWLLWPGLAILATVTTLTQAQVSLSFPSTLAGRANSAYNLLLFIGAFAVQWSIGLLSDSFQAYGMSAPNAMRAAFGVCVLLQAAALAGFMSSRARRTTATV